MNSYPIDLPGYHQVLIAGGMFPEVSMKRISGSFGAFISWLGIVWSIASGVLPSALSTLMTLRLELGSASRNRYLPAGRVTPGNVIGVVNVK